MNNFDIVGAIREGFQPGDIADHLAKKTGFDIIGARQSGASDEAILEHISKGGYSKALNRIRAEDIVNKQAQEEYAINQKGLTSNFVGNVAAGFGKALVDTARGVRQLLPGDNTELQSEIDEAKQRDMALMSSGGGLLGNIAGHAAITALPFGAVTKGAQALNAGRTLGTLGKVLTSLPGRAGLSGAAEGFITPVATDESRLANTGIGVGGGLLGAAIGRAIPSTLGFLKSSFVEPFTKSGQESIAARPLLEAIGGNVDDVLRRLETSGPLTKGTAPTLAEVADDVGLARAQKSISSLSTKIGEDLRARDVLNNRARLGVLDELTGDLSAAEAEKSAKGKLMSAAKDAYTGELKGSRAIIKNIDDQLKGDFGKVPEIKSGLLAVKKALYDENPITERAKGIVKSFDGILSKSLPKLDADSVISVQKTMRKLAAGKISADEAKTALRAAKEGASSKVSSAIDDALKIIKQPDFIPTKSATGIRAAGILLNDTMSKTTDNATLRALGQTKSILDSKLDKIPGFEDARNAFKAAAREVDRLKIGESIRDKATSNLDYMRGDPKVLAGQLANALEHGKSVARSATGFKRAGDLTDYLKPEHMQSLGLLKKDLGRVASTTVDAATKGSDTFQNLVMGNIMGKTFGPLGLGPLLESNFGKYISTLSGKTLGKVLDEQAQAVLSKSALDPKFAAQIIRNEILKQAGNKKLVGNIDKIAPLIGLGLGGYSSGF